MKHIAIAALLVLTPVIASAQAMNQPTSAYTSASASIEAQIQSLLTQVAQLRLQLSAMNGTAGSGNSIGMPPVMCTCPLNYAPGSSEPTPCSCPTGSGTGSVWSSNGSVSGTSNNCPIYTRPLVVGIQGQDVSAYQSYLSNIGVYQGPVTGYYGPLTAKAVAQWQNQNGISAVGKVGPITGSAMANSCSVGSGTVWTGPATGSGAGTAGGSTGGSTGDSAGNTQPDTLVATPSSGSAPLQVTFSTSASIAGSYVVEFGDGAHMQLEKGSCVGMMGIIGGNSGLMCQFTTTHTYASAGTYTATLSPYTPCLYSTPRCMVATRILATATITVQ